MARTPPSELLMRQRVSAVTRALPAARDGDAASLHQARIATRRLREALPLLASGSIQRKLDRRVRKITRALGPVRELDVALQILDEMSASDDVPRAALTRLRDAVSEEREVRRHEMLRYVEESKVDKLRKRAMSAARKHSNRARSKAADPKRAIVVRERSARRAERLVATIESAAGLYLPDRLHDVRIAVKKLRYALEIAGTVGRTRTQAQVRTLKKAQDLLGRMHDLEVLIARTRDVQGSSSAPTLKLSGQLDRFVRKLENECRQLHGRYIAMRAPLLTLCEQVIDARSRRPASAA
jgi:CHAD domain-containing protein